MANETIVVDHVELKGKLLISDNEFYEALGRLIVSWQQVEIALADLFATLMQSDEFLSVKAHYSVMNFNTRLDMTDRVAELALHESDLKDDWGELHKRLKRYAKKRNNMVHADIGFNPLHALNATENFKYELVLIPFYVTFDMLSDKNKRTGNTFNTAKLREWASRFDQLWMDIYKLNVELRKELDLPEEILGSSWSQRAQLPVPEQKS